ncbi:lipoprotein [Sphingobacterium multivorum]|uniref:lipoprotein n=1 Tax=Sphingobacterium multivorum TaxID=28454 RepID=UPI00289DF98D|nr:lipoprotein [Sphingobacterium multivorum]
MMRKIILFIILVFFLSGCFQKPAIEKSRIDYRIGNCFIRLYIDNIGQATAQSGRLIERDDKSFVIGRILDSTKFTVKTGGDFISRLKKINKPVVESGNGYSRTQIFLGDSLYYDTNMYTSNFWKLYSIISDEIPNEFNPFKIHQFD